MAGDAANPQQPDKKGQTLGGLFGQKTKAPESSAEFLSLRQEFNSLARRLREIEDRYQNFRKKVNVFDSNLLSQSKKNSTEFKVMYSEIDDMKHILEDFDNKMLLMIKEIKQCAKEQDVKVLQRYIDMWEPIRFVTRREVDRMLDEKLDEKLKNVRKVVRKVIKTQGMDDKILDEPDKPSSK